LADWLIWPIGQQPTAKISGQIAIGNWPWLNIFWPIWPIGQWPKWPKLADLLL